MNESISTPPKRRLAPNRVLSKKVKYTPKSKYPKFTLNKSIVNLGAGFPKRIISTLRYADSFGITSTAGSVGKYNFVCNGLYDPNQTGGGNQPMYFDQFMALYNHYLVRKTKIKVTMCTPVAALAWGVFVNDDATTTPSTITDIQENTLSTTLESNINSLPQAIYKYWNTWSYFGQSPEANDELHGSASANPAENSFFTIYAGTLDATTATNIQFQVMIEYETEFFELKDIAGS